MIALSATGAASAAIYWTGSGISRAAHDGTNVEDPFIRAIGGSGLAVDGSYLYSPSPGGSPRHASIDRARVDEYGRANDHFILTAGDPRGVAVDGSRVYWTQEFPTFNPLPTYPSAIGRAALDGSQLDQNFIDLGTTRVTDVAVDAAHVYWTWTDCPRGECGGAVGRANVDGSNVEPNFIVTADYPAGLAVDAGRIYWANRVVDAMGNFSPSLAGQSSIGRAGLDGSDVAQNFITGASSATDVAVDEARIYWSNLFLSADDEGSIGAALIDGSRGRAEVHRHLCRRRACSRPATCPGAGRLLEPVFPIRAWRAVVRDGAPQVSLVPAQRRDLRGGRATRKVPQMELGLRSRDRPRDAEGARNGRRVRAWPREIGPPSRLLQGIGVLASSVPPQRRGAWLDGRLSDLHLSIQLRLRPECTAPDEWRDLPLRARPTAAQLTLFGDLRNRARR